MANSQLTGSPDGGRKKKRSPSDLRREARRMEQRLEAARVERRVAWPEGGQELMAAERQEAKLRGLYQEKRGWRRGVYAENPQLEGREFRRHHPGARPVPKTKVRGAFR